MRNIDLSFQVEEKPLRATAIMRVMLRTVFTIIATTILILCVFIPIHVFDGVMYSTHFYFGMWLKNQSFRAWINIFFIFLY